MDFQNFTNNQTFSERTFCSLEHSQGRVRSHTKFAPNEFSRFAFYWMKTNRQTNSQAKFLEDFNEIIRRKQTK